MPRVVAVFDSGISNLHSVVKALGKVSGEGTSQNLKIVATRDPEQVCKADALVVPGVGAFGAYVKELRRSGVFEAAREVAQQGRPVLGVCVGMQAFFDSSEESPGAEGLGFFAGRLARLEDAPTVPHIGWNQLVWHKDVPNWLAGLQRNTTARWMYFDHSYSVKRADIAPEYLTASSVHGQEFAAVVCRQNVVGVQFHPEKSAGAGLALYRYFLDWAFSPAHF